jgi:hypothetical protein
MNGWVDGWMGTGRGANTKMAIKEFRDCLENTGGAEKLSKNFMALKKVTRENGAFVALGLANRWAKLFRRREIFMSPSVVVAIK